MTRFILVLGLLMLFFSCKSSKITADSSDKFIIENLSKAAAQGNLAEIYPEANISEGTDMFEEGNTERAYSILYPGTSNEILLTWNDINREQLYQIQVDHNGKWHTKNGIQIGTTYEALQKYNKHPIEFYGFGWDYSGAVDWKGGKMESSKIRVFLGPEGKIDNIYYGDHVIQASAEEIDSMQLSVKSMIYQQTQP